MPFEGYRRFQPSGTEPRGRRRSDSRERPFARPACLRRVDRGTGRCQDELVVDESAPRSAVGTAARTSHRQHGDPAKEKTRQKQQQSRPWAWRRNRTVVSLVRFVMASVRWIPAFSDGRGHRNLGPADPREFARSRPHRRRQSHCPLGVPRKRRRPRRRRGARGDRSRGRTGQTEAAAAVQKPSGSRRCGRTPMSKRARAGELQRRSRPPTTSTPAATAADRSCSSFAIIQPGAEAATSC